MSRSLATSRRQRNGWSVVRTVLAASLVVTLTGCGVFSEPPSAAQTVLLERRDAIAELPEFADAPSGATSVKDQRFTGCEDADWAEGTPSAYRLYKIAPERLQQSVRELRNSWEQSGWTLSGTSDFQASMARTTPTARNLGPDPGSWTR